MAQIALKDFYNEGQAIEIPLDPSSSPQENLDKLYRKAKKYQAALPHIERRLEHTLLQEEELTTQAQSLAERHPGAPLDDLKQWLPKPKTRREKKPEKPAPLSPFPKSKRAGNLGSAEVPKPTTRLTFHHARGNDLWLHAAGFAGSHVVLRLPKDKALDQESLLDAATLAAHYSKAKNDTRVEVHYIHRKHLRKPKGAGPGRVSLANPKSLIIEIEAKRLRRLMDKAPDNDLAR